MISLRPVQEQVLTLQLKICYILTADLTQCLAVFQEILLVRCIAGAELLVPLVPAKPLGIRPILTASAYEEMRNIYERQS